MVPEQALQPQHDQQQQEMPGTPRQQQVQLPECDWRECELAAALEGMPTGVLPDEAARAVVAAVAFGLERLHADGLVHRHLCAHTVTLGERACFDTTRCVPCSPCPHFTAEGAPGLCTGVCSAADSGQLYSSSMGFSDASLCMEVQPGRGFAAPSCALHGRFMCASCAHRLSCLIEG
jgi:hypothetical protein